MNYFDFFDKFMLLIGMLRRGYTGTPDELAERLSISRSAVYRMIDELNARGAEIKYSRSRCTFYYSSDMLVEFHFNITSLSEIKDPNEMKSISGGCSFSDDLARPVERSNEICTVETSSYNDMHLQKKHIFFLPCQI